MLKKILEWSKRYLPGEIISFVTSLLAGLIAHSFTNNPVAIAYAATWGTIIGYYTTQVAREVRASARSVLQRDRHRRLHITWKTLRNVVLEFGAAELLDSFVLRPLFILLFERFVSLGLAVLLGNLVANVTFYIPTIAAYELRKKYIEN